MATTEFDAWRLLAINAYAAYSNALMASGYALAARRQLERTIAPQPGDVVLETSTVWRWARYAEEAPRQQYPELGVLLRITHEPFPRQDGEENDGRLEIVHYVRPLDGSVLEYRWTNASFIRVLTSLDDQR